MQNNNFSVKTIIGFFGLVIVLFTAHAAFAQTRVTLAGDVMPKRIIKDRFKKSLKGDERESFFVFEVGPGETVLKIRIKALQDNAGAQLYFKDRNDEEVVPFVLVQGISNEGETVETVRIESTRSRLIYMQIKEIRYGSRATYPGILEIDFSGAFLSWEEER